MTSSVCLRSPTRISDWARSRDASPVQVLAEYARRCDAAGLREEAQAARVTIPVLGTLAREAPPADDLLLAAWRSEYPVPIMNRATISVERRYRDKRKTRRVWMELGALTVFAGVLGWRATRCP